MKLFLIAFVETLLMIITNIVLMVWHPFHLHRLVRTDQSGTHYFEFDWMIVLFIVFLIFAGIAGLAKSRKGFTAAVIAFAIGLALGWFYFHLGPYTPAV